MDTIPSIKTLRLLAFAVVILALIGFSFGVQAIRGHIKGGEPKTASTFQTLDEQEAAKLAELKIKDTDRDGINDYDELFIYRTSPYLEDTDSDGYSDKMEIDSGNDPNCPKGKSCVSEEGNFAASSTLTLPPIGITNTTPQGFGATDLFSLVNKNPAEIRTELEKAGVAKELLDSVDDKTLLELYRASLKEAAASGTVR